MTDETAAKRIVSRVGRELLDQGLTKGTGGNVSAQFDSGERIAINPSGVPYREIDPEDVPVVTLDGEQVSGDLDASSETPMHTMIYRRREDVGGIVHTHSPYASTFAALDRPIEGSHYLIAHAGSEIPVAGYATPGSEELGRHAVETLGTDHDACLLKNHGVIAVGAEASGALEVASMVEYVARVHYQALNLGDPAVLPDEELDRLRGVFEEYGQY